MSEDELDVPLGKNAEALPREDLVRLVRLVGTVAAPLPSDRILERLLDVARAETGAARAWVVVPRGVAVAQDPLGSGERRQHATAPLEELLVRVERPEGGAHDPSATRCVRAAVARGESTSEGALACFPLRRRRSVLGALVVEGRFTARDLGLLEGLAAYAAITLERAPGDARPRENARPVSGMVGRSRELRRLFRTLEKIRQHDASVLIEGETGTGKELVARAIHAASRRAREPFVVESCTAIPETLLEAEIFGYEAGAFTGAVEGRPGAFERAHGGTLFLDDLGDASPRLQGLLLRVLETGEVRPLGAPAPRKVDCRVVASSRQDVGALVAAGRFREDLFFRLNVLRVVVPPLRERKEDLPALAEAFLRELGRPASDLSPRGLEALLHHPWPGNVRELKHALERASLLAGDAAIDAAHLGFKLPDDAPGGETSPTAGKVSFRGHVLNKRQLELLRYLEANGVATNREYVRLVGVSVPTGWRDLKELLAKELIQAAGDGRNTVYRLAPGSSEALESRG